MTIRFQFYPQEKQQKPFAIYSLQQETNPFLKSL